MKNRFVCDIVSICTGNDAEKRFFARATGIFESDTAMKCAIQVKPVHGQAAAAQRQGLDPDPILCDPSVPVSVFNTQPLALVDRFEYLSANVGHTVT